MQRQSSSAAIDPPGQARTTVCYIRRRKQFASCHTHGESLRARTIPFVLNAGLWRRLSRARQQARPRRLRFHVALAGRYHSRTYRSGSTAPSVSRLAPASNLGLHGAGLSVGPRGLHVGVNGRGIYTSAGIPGTGIYAVHHIRSSAKRTHVLHEAPRA